MDCCFCFRREDAFLQNRQEAPRPALPLDVIIRGLSQGTVMYKVKSPDHWYKRRYKVDIQNMRLTYTPSSKPFCGGSKDPVVDLYDVEDVRIGWTTDIFNRLEAKFRRMSTSRFHPKMRDALKEENCFAVICLHSQVINLIAPNRYTRDAWVRGLTHLIATCKSAQLRQEHLRWLKDQVRKADVNNNGSLNFNECLILLRQLNISMDKKDVKKLFDSANFRKSKIDGEDALDPEEFVKFYESLTRRPELEELMKKHSVSRTPIFGADELQSFIQKEQKTPISLEECEHLIEHYEPEAEKIQGYLTAKGFEELLLSAEGHIMNKRHRIIYQDMTHPLAHYYIASSHNTYLLHGQLIGQSSVEGYIQALQRGCRCLELDTWDGPDGEPIVFHGYTLTSRIFLRDILQAIKDYAFRSSQYPVILSIENHCSVPYQIKMAEHFVNILGEYLQKSPIAEDETKLPSPEQLARKILIKAKKIKESVDEEVMLLEEEEEQEARMMAAQSPQEPSEGSLEAPRHYEKLAKELSDLVNYCSAVRFTSFEDCKKKWEFSEMASFQETKGKRLAAEQGTEFIAHNMKHLSRVYPKGSRTDSSNYDPLPFWNVGCQMVALNYQTWDKFMFTHEARFAQNGRCGYVLKPKFLTEPEKMFSSLEKPDTSLQRTILIRVISGQRLPKPHRASEGEIVDPYVVMKITGHPLDEQKKKTSYVRDNGFNPVWNEMFMFVVHVPDVDIITFSVKDQNFAGKNELLGKYALPVASLAEGYRHVHLEDSRGHPLIPASIFVHVTVGTSTIPLPDKKK